VTSAPCRFKHRPALCRGESRKLDIHQFFKASAVEFCAKAKA
jgi:hypothetical protein